MKILAIIIMLAALYLLWRIVYPKQASTKKDNETPPEVPKNVPDVMGKPRLCEDSRGTIGG